MKNISYYFNVPLLLRITVISMALSVSLTHLFAFLTVISWIFTWSQSDDRLKMHHIKRLPSPFIYGILLFFWFIISYTFHLATGNNTFSMTELYRSEIGDIVFLLPGIIAYRTASTESGYKHLMKSIYIFSWILVISGFVSIFSEFRLSRLIMGAGFEPSAWNRPQHPAFLLGGFQLYQPIGFMNTKLTYAGLLIMVIPIYINRLFMNLTKSQGNPKNKISFLNRENIEMIIWLILAAAVLFINKTRSATIGLFISLVALIPFILIRMHTNKNLRSNANDNNDSIKSIFHNKYTFLKFIIPVFITIVAAFAAIENSSSLLIRFQSMVRHTDYQRAVIWSGSMDIFKNHPIAGAGPGNFTREIQLWKERFTQKYPQTWYFVNNTPDGHAHNDLLHVLAVGGIPSGFLFMLIVFTSLRYKTYPSISRTFTDRKASIMVIARGGLAAFYLAGLFQCYFQDAETVILLWVLTGLIKGSETLPHYNLTQDESDENSR